MGGISSERRGGMVIAQCSSDVRSASVGRSQSAVRLKILLANCETKFIPNTPLYPVPSPRHIAIGLYVQVFCKSK